MRNLRNLRREQRRGMTLVEVMVVIAIVLTLMSALALGVWTVFSDAQAETTKVTMNRAAQKVEIYYLRKKKIPNDLGEVFAGEPEPVDGWGNKFVLRAGGNGNRKFDLISYGADGAEGGSGNDEDIRLSDL
jgi:general secretion pathway protein G